MIHGRFYFEPIIQPPSIMRISGEDGVIDRIILYLTHDVIMYNDGIVCLNIFEGNVHTPFPHKFIRDVTEKSADDLQVRTNDLLPSTEIKEARTLARQLELYPDLRRTYHLCDVCKQY